MGLFHRLFRRSSVAVTTAASMPADPNAPVRAYHEATKHHQQRPARGPAGLDWATQPDPFRRYDGAELVKLPVVESEQQPAWDAVVCERSANPAAVNEHTLSCFLRYALGLSAVKQYGDSRWALRMNPSSGNLHPTEAHVLLGPVTSWRAEGLVAHYAPAEHALEVRAKIDPDVWKSASKDWPTGVFFVALTSIFWREEWKYGERAYRYCQHDVGHAIAALAYSAACLGWKVRMVEHLGSDGIAKLFGLHGFGAAEAEEAELLLAILPGEDGAAPSFTADALKSLTAAHFAGEANELSSDHLEWDAIHACAAESSKPPTPSLPELPRPAPLQCSSSKASAHAILAQRRSAVAMDGKTRMSREAFFEVLARCMPSAGSVPFEAFPWSPRVHLVLFVHRVDDVPPGLYVLPREEHSGARLLGALSRRFEPTPVEGAPAGLPLTLLKAGSMQSIAAAISCGQAIAGEGTFSCGMLAEFDAALTQHGPWFYPRLFWETGLVGQSLYLEAEAAGLRGTGIGCFFDDAMHELLGLHDRAFQSLYHFTIGGPVEDTRILVHTPYTPLPPESCPS